MKQQTVVDASEILFFAEKDLGISWNTCHDILYQGHEILYSPESSTKMINLNNICEDLEWYQQNREHKFYKVNKRRTYEILKAFMMANNLTEMLVLNKN